MQKRLILAIALSMLILLVWSMLAPKPQSPGPAVSPQQIQPALKPENQLISSPAQEPPPLTLLKSSPGKFEVTFIESLAAIKEAIFKDYQSYEFSLKYGFLLGDNRLRFRRLESTSKETIFVYEDKEKKIIKRFIFSNSNYDIELEIEIHNLSASIMNVNLPLILGVLDFSADQNRTRFQDITVVLKDKTLHLNGRKDTALEKIQFIAIRDKYFCLIVEPGSEYAGFVKKVNSHETEVGLNLQNIFLEPGNKTRQTFRIYLGPQDLQAISNIKSEWSAVVHYGTFDFISHLLLQLLGFFYQIVHNWGLAIIILSLAIYMLLFPFTLKQMRSMKEMQILQPRIEELRKTYKDNPQRLNKEIIELYREHKVNPIGGCLPLILQMPVFFALYQVLMRSIALKGAKFLWIKDLSEPDRLFILRVSLPILGNEINILPILMTAIMFIQQKSSMKAPGSSSAQQQKIMMIIFPLIFGIIFYHMPSGLVLYWFVNSLLMLIFQLRISK